MVFSDPNLKAISDMYDHATAPDIQSRQPEFAILPIGSFEQHGAHLPMETDTLIACSIAKRIRQAYNCFIVSPITVSCSHEHSGFFPSLWVSPFTLHAIVNDLARSLEFHGLKKLCIINAHGGNYILDHFAQMENIDSNRILLMPKPSLLNKAINASGIGHDQKSDMHAGEYETSVLLADYPDFVIREMARNHHTEERDLLHLHGLRYYSESGVIGYPEHASAEKGQRVLFELISVLKPLIDEFLSLTDEKRLSPRSSLPATK
jgi:creatinine amidohydrolase